MLLLLALCLSLQEPTSVLSPDDSQQDVVDVARRLLGRTPPPDDGEDKRRVIVPTISSSPGAGTAFGVLMTSQDRDETSGELSVTHIGASYSTAHRLQTAVRFDRHRNATWQVVGDWRFYDFTERTYGLGSDTTPDTFRDVTLAWGRLHTTVYRRVAGELQIGGGYLLDVRKVEDFGGSLDAFDNRTTYASGMSLDATFDSRDNPTNATRGWLGRGSLAWFPDELGSDRDWQSLELEGRTYATLPSARRQIIAVWALAWLTTSGDPNYFDLPGNGWDMYGRTSRGYAAGRFRGRDWIDVEAEYRVDLMANGLVGAVAFASSSTFSDGRNRFGRWVPAGGTGVRIKFDKHHGANLCLDYGWGIDGSRGLFLALNEAF